MTTEGNRRSMDHRLREPIPPARTAAFALGLLIVVAVAVVVGPAVIARDRSGVLLPLAAVGGLALAVISITRFELFVMLVIAMRASMDAAKVGTSSVDATGALSVLFIGATALWLYRHPEERSEPSSVRGLVAPFSAFFLAGILSIASSTHPLESAIEAVRIGTVVVIVVALSRIAREPARRRSLIVAILVSALVPLAVASFQLVGGAGLKTFEGFSRIQGTFVHPNSLAMYLFLVLVLAVSIVPHLRGWQRLAVMALAFGCGGILITTYARGAWVATLIGFLVIAFLQSRALFWVIGGAVLVVALAVPSVGIRLSDLQEERSPSGAPANSLAWRIEYWGEVLRLQDEPVFGIGLREVELNQEAQKAPHNDFVRVYVETGVVGLLAYLWLLGALFVEGVRAFRRAPPGLPRGLAVAMLAALSGLTILSIAANVISQLVILWYFAAIVVMALSAADVRQRSAVRAG